MHVGANAPDVPAVVGGESFDRGHIADRLEARDGTTAFQKPLANTNGHRLSDGPFEVSTCDLCDTVIPPSVSN